MAVYCPNNNNTYGSIQLWIDAVRDTDFGSPATGVVKDNETFQNKLNIVGTWPNGIRLVADNAFNGVYDTQAVTTLEFLGNQSIIFSIVSGIPSKRKPVELTGFIYRHKGEGPQLTDNITFLDLNINENMFDSIGRETDSEWVGANNIDILTHESTVDIRIEDNICLGAAREGIKVYNNLNTDDTANVHINNNVVYNASSESDSFDGIKVFGGCKVDLNNNISLTRYKNKSKGFDYSQAVINTKTGNATDSNLEDIEITNESDLFVNPGVKNFQIKSDSPYLISNPNLGTFKQTVIGKGTSYPVEVEFTDFNFIKTNKVTATTNVYNVNLLIGGIGVAEGYNRQASFMDGDVILADHGNLEFDQLVRAFNESVGHKHDGSIGGGALVPKIGDEESGNILEIDDQGVKGNVISNDISMAADSNRLLPTQQASKGYTDSKTTGPYIKQQIENLPDTNFIDDTNLAKLSSLPAVGSGFLPENPVDDLVYVRKNTQWIELPRTEWDAIDNKPYTLAGYGITDAISTTDTAADSALFNNQPANYYTNIVGRLGYTPVQQGGGSGQGAEKVHIGWLGSELGLQVGTTNYGGTWPITSTNATQIGGVDASQVYSTNNPPPPTTSVPLMTKGSYTLMDVGEGMFFDTGGISIKSTNNNNLRDVVGAYVSPDGWRYDNTGSGAILHETDSTSLNPKVSWKFGTTTTNTSKNSSVTWDLSAEITKDYLGAKELKEGGVSLKDKYYLQSEFDSLQESTGIGTKWKDLTGPATYGKKTFYRGDEYVIRMPTDDVNLAPPIESAGRSYFEFDESSNSVRDLNIKILNNYTVKIKVQLPDKLTAGSKSILDDDDGTNRFALGLNRDGSISSLNISNIKIDGVDSSNYTPTGLISELTLTASGSSVLSTIGERFNSINKYIGKIFDLEIYDDQGTLIHYYPLRTDAVDYVSGNLVKDEEFTWDGNWPLEGGVNVNDNKLTFSGNSQLTTVYPTELKDLPVGTYRILMNKTAYSSSLGFKLNNSVVDPILSGSGDLDVIKVLTSPSGDSGFYSTSGTYVGDVTNFRVIPMKELSPSADFSDDSGFILSGVIITGGQAVFGAASGSKAIRNQELTSAGTKVRIKYKFNSRTTGGLVAYSVYGNGNVENIGTFNYSSDDEVEILEYTLLNDSYGIGIRATDGWDGNVEYLSITEVTDGAISGLLQSHFEPTWKPVTPIPPDPMVAIDSRLATSPQALAGLDAESLMTPERVKEFLNQYGYGTKVKTLSGPNLNNYYDTSMILYATGTTTAPSTGSYLVDVVAGNNTAGNYPVASQRAVDIFSASPKTYTRRYQNGSWSPWVLVYDTGNKPTPAGIGALAEDDNDVLKTKGRNDTYYINLSSSIYLNKATRGSTAKAVVKGSDEGRFIVETNTFTLGDTINIQYIPSGNDKPLKITSSSGPIILPDGSEVQASLNAEVTKPCNILLTKVINALALSIA